MQFDGRLLWYYTQATNTSRYFHVNALGSLGLATDQTGAPVEEMLHYPFGREWVNTAGFGWDEKFARFPQHDTDLALYMTAFREYNPSLGRWLTPDKLAGDVTNPQSLNRYAYALNNPVSYIDPSGLDPCPPGVSADVCVVATVDDIPTWTSPIPGLSNGPGPGTPGDTGTGGGGGNGANDGLLDKLKKAYCSAVPTGRSTSVSGALGGIGAVSGEGDMLLNYNSGQTSLFATGGMSFGWNGGASATASSGFVYGLGKTNNGFSGRFKGGSFYAPTPIPFVSAGGSVIHGGSVTVVSFGVSASVVGRYGFGASVTNTTKPLKVGKFSGFSFGDFIGYLARRPCN